MVSVRKNAISLTYCLAVGIVGVSFSGPSAAESDTDVYQTESFTGDFIESVLANSRISSRIVSAPTADFLNVVASGQLPMNGCTIRPGNISFSILSADSGPVETGFILDGAGKYFSRCDSGACEKNTLLKSGVVEQDLGKTRVRIQPHGKLCEAAGEVFYPSWFLDRLRRNSGANPGVSDRLLVSSSSNQITIYDLKKKDIFFQLKDSSAQTVLKKVGVLSYVLATNEGFFLTGQGGFVSIDFVKDVVIAGSGGFLYFHPRLGSGVVEQWQEEISLEDEKFVQPLSAGSGRVLFPQGVLSVNFELKSGGLSSSFIESPKGQVLVSGVPTPNGFDVVFFDGSGFVRQNFDGKKWAGVVSQVPLEESLRNEVDPSRRMAIAGDVVYGVSKGMKNISNLRSGSAFESSGVDFESVLGGHRIFVNVLIPQQKDSLFCSLAQIELKHGSVLSKNLDTVSCNSATSGYGATIDPSVGTLQSATVRVGSKEIRFISRKNN